ncbi:hypothetical protein U1Q18_039275 [Sarracenia purpurea var. burkii]
MESQTLMVGARRQLSVSRRRRTMLHKAKSLRYIAVLICTLFHSAVCEPCPLTRTPPEDVAGGSYRNNDNNVGFQDVYVGDVGSGYVLKTRVAKLNVENICSNSNLFCFPSTLPGILSEEHSPESSVLEASSVQSDATLPVGSTQARNNLSWSSDYGTFKLLSGRAVSCSLNSQEGTHGVSSLQTIIGNQNYVSSCGGPLHNQKSPDSILNENFQMSKSGFLDGSLSPYIEIKPPLLDWGHKYLYLPSFAFLTVANTHSDSILYLYEPFSTSTQFYPCNFSEVLLRPGEVASMCFVFLPTWLGMSSAQLILQTSSGGFLIQAKGFAVESPYGIEPLMGLDISSSGRWGKNLSLFNPFDETLHVEEVTAWLSVSVGNTSRSTTATCKIGNYQGSADRSVSNIKEWLNGKSGQVGSPVPLMAMRPHRNWDIDPGNTETVIEIDLSDAGMILGVFCLQLLRSSQDKPETIMIPFEAEMGGQSAGHFTDSVSLSLERLVPCDASENVFVALSLRNSAPHLLNVVNISLIGESTKLFQIKHMEGLILFPGTVTQVAVVSYIPPPIGLHDSPTGIPNINFNCKLTILTNDSSSPQLEALCKDIISICSKIDLHPQFEQQTENAEHANARTGSLGSNVQLPSEIKTMEAAAPDELVLGNWKSQGSVSGMSVLDEHEVLFPIVQVGTYHSKWITVKNPSQQPVVMQLILNSGEIVDECRPQNGILQPSSSSGLIISEYTAPIRYGFSIGESALTEAYVHPYETASFGPILFHPSSRCGWRSSALIRNNLSGVEWLSLRGFGGSFSLVLFEGSKPVQSLEFKFNLPSLNISPPDVFHHKEEATYTCSRPLSKELYAKNTGDLPLDVRRIEVSGTECRLNGFLVHTCEGFTLEPGKSTKLLISYQADFSSLTVQRDLELALGTGIFVIPMKASLSLHMLNLCKKSMFWTRVKKFFFIVISALMLFLVLFCILPQLGALGPHDYLLKSGKNSIATVRHVGKSSRLHSNQKNSNNLSVSSKMNGLLRSIGEEETLLLESVRRHPDEQGVASEQGIPAQHDKQAVGHQTQTNYLQNTQKEMAFKSRAMAESSTIESSVVQEASRDGKLTVRIGKEKGRRRRKKKGSGTVLTGIFEVSSSQSGNSTPSSPLSPVTSFPPRRPWPATSDADQLVETRNQFAQVTEQQCQKSSGTKSTFKENILGNEVSSKYSHENQIFLAPEKPSTPRKIAGKAVLLPSATFPCASRPIPNFSCSSPFMASALASSIAPHARAPGSNLYNRKTAETEEKVGLEDQFKYDIWGEHLSGLHLVGTAKVSSVTSGVAESLSDSFFVSGPQTLMKNSQPKSKSSSYQED